MKKYSLILVLFGMINMLLFFTVQPYFKSHSKWVARGIYHTVISNKYEKFLFDEKDKVHYITVYDTQQSLNGIEQEEKIGLVVIFEKGNQNFMNEVYKGDYDFITLINESNKVITIDLSQIKPDTSLYLSQKNHPKWNLINEDLASLKSIDVNYGESYYNFRKG